MQFPTYRLVAGHGFCRCVFFDHEERGEMMAMFRFGKLVAVHHVDTSGNKTCMTPAEFAFWIGSMGEPEKENSGEEHGQ